MDKAPIARLYGMALYIQDTASAKEPLRYKWQQRFFTQAVGTLEDDTVRDTVRDMMMDAALVQSEGFAKAIIHELKTVVPFNHRYPQKKSLYLLRQMVPTVLVELGFIDNPEDIARMQDPIRRENIAMGMAYAVVEYAKKQGLYQDDTQPVDKRR